MAATLALAVAGCGFHLAGSYRLPPALAKPYLSFSDPYTQRVLSVSATNIPTEYELVYTVTFSVRGADKVLIAPQTISQTRDYSFEEQIVLAKQHEADVLRAQMARDLAAIAMRRLTSLK